MTHTATNYPSTDTPSGWLRRAEYWLDDKGKGAWIAAMVLGFIFVWPVGLFLLFYMIWGKKMFSNKCTSRSSRHSYRRSAAMAMKSSGNTAFDAYKADTLRRLEEEQNSFESFLDRLRAAKDKAEFDQFMEDRAKSSPADDEKAETEEKEEA
ncbi:DUF2852 domain-containing protein [Celeribacter arenosi]|uniref:DUF2852 domain-containing protein n=1 Tax=Celeribacter arenosi TaxID=792649 RepID=A0ABP7KD92_9RHOB